HKNAAKSAEKISRQSPAEPRSGCGMTQESCRKPTRRVGSYAAWLLPVFRILGNWRALQLRALRQPLDPVELLKFCPRLRLRWCNRDQIHQPRESHDLPCAHRLHMEDRGTRGADGSGRGCTNEVGGAGKI